MVNSLLNSDSKVGSVKKRYWIVSMSLSLLIVLLCCLLSCKKAYSIVYIDELTRQVVSAGNTHAIISILDYKFEADVDGGNSLHYYANLYVCHLVQPDFFQEISNNRKYRSIIERSVKLGSQYFETYYPDILVDTYIQELQKDK